MPPQALDTRLAIGGCPSDTAGRALALAQGTIDVATGVRLPAGGLADVSCYPALLAELIDRGWSDAELAGLTRRNVIRVLADAQPAHG